MLTSFHLLPSHGVSSLERKLLSLLLLILSALSPGRFVVCILAGCFSFECCGCFGFCAAMIANDSDGKKILLSLQLILVSNSLDCSLSHIFWLGRWKTLDNNDL